MALFFLASCGSEVKIETADSYESIDLPDGSFVLLNKNSSIGYEKSFDERKVTLNGEAFFSVEKGTNPFVVVTEHGDVQVLGTEFNVKSDKENLEVEVEEGHVQMKANNQRTSIKRNERGAYNKSRNAVKRGTAEFKFKIWINDLKQDFKKAGKEVKKAGKEVSKEVKEETKEIRKEAKEAGKEVGKETKKVTKEVGKETKKVGNEIKKDVKKILN